MANFLGKKISLISKAGIRYEGILYTIDPTESTVALSKVKSFGTEDRPSERFISPRDEVYEYIIFRGSDIRDLHVCENSLYSEDSAIVKIMSPNFTNQPPHVPLPPHGIDVGVPDIHPQNQERSPSGFHSTPNQNDNRIINNHLLSSKSLDRDSLGHSENKPIQTPRTHDKSELQKDKDEKFDMDKIAANDYHNFLNRDQSFKYDTYINDEFRENSNYRRGGGGQRQRGMKNQDSRRGSQFSGSNGNVILNNNRGYRANKEVTIEPIKDDFDFESSNAILAEELANINVSNDDNNRVGNLSESKEPSDQNLADYVEEKLYYDKSKSFFDNISSETSERTNSERRNERRSNTETFGDSNYNRNNRGNRWGNRRGHFRGNYSRGSSAGFLRRGNYLNRGDMRGHGQVSGSINKRLIPVGGNRGNMNEN